MDNVVPIYGKKADGFKMKHTRRVNSEQVKSIVPVHENENFAEVKLDTGESIIILSADSYKLSQLNG